MKTKAAKLLEDALNLPPADRADMASCLYGSLDVGAEEVLDEKWADEIRRRIREVDEGTEKLVPWQEAEKQIFGDE